MKHPQSLVNLCLLIAVGGAYWGRRTENFTGPKDFLRAQSFSFRGWKEVDNKLTQDEETLLKPDAVVVRSYDNGNEFLEFAVIAGHRKQTVHTPAYCMVGGGWEKVSTKNIELSLPTVKIPAVRSIMIKERQELMVTYFFTDGDSSTTDLTSFQGTQFLRRIRGENPLGALVRIAVPITRDRTAAERLSMEFVNEHVPKVLSLLKEARRPQ